jgi:hypothetical protein
MKKSQLKEIVRQIIKEELELESQASDTAKQQGLEYMKFGRWGKGGKVTHTTQSGKLVPLKSMGDIPARKAKAGNSNAAGGKIHPVKTPDVQRHRNTPQPAKDAKYNAHGHTGTDAGNRIVTKVNDKFWDSEHKLLDKYEYFDDIPADEFTSATGIPKQAAVWTAQNNNDYEQPFGYDADTDTFSINDPRDV